ncbi:MAG: Gfo/Idh/MocA family oxidoreductase [Bryobacteraceae bacterium]
MEKTLRIALIGQGSMGRAHSNAYRQVASFYDLPYAVEQSILCGRNPATLTAMAQRWGWRETAADWRDVIARPDIDIVDVAVPNSLHAEIAIAAAQAGKIVFCEKPLANSTVESAAMRDAVSNRPNMVWFNYRRVPAIQLLRSMIDDNRIGPIFHFRAFYLQEWGNDPSRPPNWKTDKAIAGSGVLGDLMSHSLDLALFLNGPIATVQALQRTFSRGREIDDATLVLARFANGSVGTFEATRYATGCRNRNAIEIHGENGAARFDLEDMNRLEFFDAAPPREEQGFRNLLVSANRYWKPGHIVGYEHTFISALGDFLQALADNEPFEPDFESGHRVQLVIDAIARAASSGSTVEVQ